MKEFTDWATIVGGFAGLLSFIYVLYEKLTTRPKLVTRTRSSYIGQSKNEKNDGTYFIEVGISLEIGNIGDESTTITEFILTLPNNTKLALKKRQSQIGFLVDDYETRMCEKGIAYVDHLKFYTWDSKEVFQEPVKGIITLRLLDGTIHKHSVELKKDE